MPWYLTRLPRGRGTNAASRARNSIGSNTKRVVPAGRIIDWAGDGYFLTFETPSAALPFGSCGLEWECFDCADARSQQVDYG